MGEKIKKAKIKNYILIITGILLMPLVISTFIIDRLILVILPHIKSPSLGEVFKDLKLFNGSIIRVVTAIIIFIIIKLIF